MQGGLVLHTGVAFCLRRFQPLIQQLARTHWLEHVRTNRRDVAVIGEAGQPFIKSRHPEIKGFNRPNLFRMRQFYESYQGQPIVSPLARQLAWTHNVLILSKCRRPDEREFYLRTCIRERWSKRELEQHLSGALFERTVLSPRFVSPPVTQIDPAAVNIFKDTYLLDFLDLPDRHDEADLHHGLVANLRRFLLELGRDFAFVGEQYRVQVGGRDFVLDLLFFHRELQALVAIELKVGEFQPEHIGKLQFYLFGKHLT